MIIRRYECVEGTSSKFWEIRVDGTDVETRFGRIGTNGTTKRKTFATNALATAAGEKLVAEKLRKGYREADAAPRAPSVTKTPSDIPNGLTKSQAARFLRLLRTAEYDHLPWEYLDERRTNLDVVDSDAASARMNLWAARQGYEHCLGKMFWAPHYHADEQLFLLETGRDKPGEADRDSPLDFVRWYGGFFLENAPALRAIVKKHDLAADWQRSRVLAFRLMQWLTDDPDGALEDHEKLGLVAALAEHHQWNPYAPLDELLGAFLGKNAGKPWFARDLALAIGTRHAWTEALMAVEDRTSMFRHHLYVACGRFARVSDVFTSMPLRDVERFLVDYDAQAMPDDVRALEAFFRARTLSPSELLHIAHGIANKRASQRRCAPSRLVDVLCILAAEQACDAEIDDFLSFSLVDDVWAERYVAILATLSPSRRRALVERDLRDENASGGGLLGVAVDESLRPLLAAYRTKKVASAFVRCAAARLGRDMADFTVAPASNAAQLEGFKTLGLQRSLASLHDKRMPDEATFFAREALEVLLRWPADHPRTTSLLEGLHRHKNLSVFTDVLPHHEQPLRLLARLSFCFQDEEDKKRASALFDCVESDGHVVDSASLSETWQAWWGDRSVAAAEEETSFAHRLARLCELSAALPGPRTPIYVMEIDQETTTTYEGSYLGGSLPRGDVDEEEKLVATLRMSEIPELQERHPEHDYLCVIVPREASEDWDRLEETRIVAVKGREEKKMTGGHAIVFHRVEVPSDLFVTKKRQDEEGVPAPGSLSDLYTALWMLPGYVLGNALVGGLYNNRRSELDSNGPDEAFLLSLSSERVIDIDGKVFFYDEYSFLER